MIHSVLPPASPPPRPWSHQARALDFCLSSLNGVLLGMEMGTGKSRVVVDLIAARGGPALVLCPKAVVPVWPDQFRRWWSGSKTVDVVTADSGRELLAWLASPRSDSSFVVVINYELSIQPKVLDELKRRLWSVLALDESHRLKDPNGKMSRAALAISNSATLRVALTGTPMPHSPLDVWAQARAIGRLEGLGPNFTAFKCRHAIIGVPEPPGWPADWLAKLRPLPPVRRGAAVQLLTTKSFRAPFRESVATQLKAWLAGYGPPLTDRQWWAITPKDPAHLLRIVGWQNMARLEADVARFAFQVKAMDVLDLPPVRDIDVPVKLSPASRKAYDALRDDLVAELEAGVVTASCALDRLGKLQQVTGGSVVDTEHPDRIVRPCGSDKREALQELLEELPPDEPVVVFAVYRADLAQIHEAAAAAGRTSCELSGQRDEVATWKADGAPTVLAVQIQSGGVGIDLTRAARAVYWSVGFDLGRYLQSRARVHRPGQERPVTYHHLIAVETIDEVVYRALEKRTDLVEATLASVARMGNREPSGKSGL